MVIRPTSIIFCLHIGFIIFTIPAWAAVNRTSSINLSYYFNTPIENLDAYCSVAVSFKFYQSVSPDAPVTQLGESQLHRIDCENKIFNLAIDGIQASIDSPLLIEIILIIRNFGTKKKITYEGKMQLIPKTVYLNDYLIYEWNMHPMAIQLDNSTGLTVSQEQPTPLNPLFPQKRKLVTQGSYMFNGPAAIIEKSLSEEEMSTKNNIFFAENC